MSETAATPGGEPTDTAVTALFDQERLHDRLAAGTLPDWAEAHYEEFRATMLGDRDGTPFPCHFGTQSERDGWALYTFVPSTTDEAALAAFRDALLAYLRTFREHSERASLVAFFRDDGCAESAAEWHEAYWRVLQYLHDHDPDPWPDAFPTDPSDHQFEFCFGGEPIFPTARAPCYERRKSRHNPHGLEITVQPRAVFDGITGDTDAGQRARDEIRNRLKAYDDVAVHDQLGNWEDEATHEWPQYMLPDDERALTTCPLEVDP